LKAFNLTLALLTDYDADMQTTEEYTQERDDNEQKCREIFIQVGNLDGVEFNCEVFMVLDIEYFRQ